jgi:putative addiction module component (TIGR02574 family)
MSRIDFSHLSTDERLDLIEALWESLNPADPPLTQAQRAELNRRLETLDEDIAAGRDADEVLADLRRRYG